MMVILTWLPVQDLLSSVVVAADEKDTIVY
jgi:hypothetical protein